LNNCGNGHDTFSKGNVETVIIAKSSEVWDGERVAAARRALEALFYTIAALINPKFRGGGLHLWAG
jgi:hypothetical protein